MHPTEHFIRAADRLAEELTDCAQELRESITIAATGEVDPALPTETTRLLELTEALLDYALIRPEVAAEPPLYRVGPDDTPVGSADWQAAVARLKQTPGVPNKNAAAISHAMDFHYRWPTGIDDALTEHRQLSIAFRELCHAINPEAARAILHTGIDEALDLARQALAQKANLVEDIICAPSISEQERGYCSDPEAAAWIAENMAVTPKAILQCAELDRLVPAPLTTARIVNHLNRLGFRMCGHSAGAPPLVYGIKLLSDLRYAPIGEFRS